MLLRRIVSSVSTLVLLGACSSTSEPGSSSPLDEDGTSSRTVRAQCTDVVTTFCKRAVDDCKLPGAGSVASCVADGVPPCCKGGCDQHALTPEAEIAACQTDLGSQSCSVLWDGKAVHLPTRCVGVVKHVEGARESGPPTRVASESVGEPAQSFGAAR